MRREVVYIKKERIVLSASGMIADVIDGVVGKCVGYVMVLVLDLDVGPVPNRIEWIE
jgi:hypothetical protein